jgi:hypothetical protein
MNKAMVDFYASNQDSVSMILDSGAFTAWKSGSIIKLDDYCRFIESLKFKPAHYVTLDVIGDSKATWKNYEIMKKRGFDPIPVFTAGGDLSELDEWYKHSDLVCIGGLVGLKNRDAYVFHVNKYLKGRKAHFLGYTSLKYTPSLRPYSCDSSSWSGAMRFGGLQIYTGAGKFKMLRKEDFIKKPTDEILHQLSISGEDWQRLGLKKTWSNTKKHGVNLIKVLPMKAWLDYSMDLKKRFDTNLYLAVVNGDDHEAQYLIDKHYSRGKDESNNCI